MEHRHGLAKPTRSQLAWHEMGRGMFFHFNMSTFRPDYDPWDEDARSPPDPSHFDPPEVDVDQWMHAARTYGAEYAVLTARHHEGFCLWPTETYEYSVANSPWKDGEGDLVREFVDACRRYDIRPGIYQSSWDTFTRTRPPGVVSERSDLSQEAYNDVFTTQLEELLRDYGDLAEIWFDGGLDAAKGPDIRPVIERHQPDAMVFQSPMATIRWVGNERGHAPYPFWNAITEEEANRFNSGQQVDDLDVKKQHGDQLGPVWLPGECDTPVRDHHWFWKPDTESSLKSLDELVEIYYRSIGRGCNLLLNANPNRAGQVPERDLELYRRLDAEIRRRLHSPIGETRGVGDTVTLELSGSARIDHVEIMERIQDGQRVKSYAIDAAVDGDWTEIATGSSVGYRKIDRIDPVATDRLRFRCTDANATPVKLDRLAAYGEPSGPQE